jgi:hypothetical protein
MEAVMRFASLAGGLMVVLSGATALAANGDRLVVIGNGVNVRARPAASAPILLQVYRNDPAIELARSGDWIEVRLPNRDAAKGWIHDSLLSAANGTGQPLASAATGLAAAEPPAAVAGPPPTPAAVASPPPAPPPPEATAGPAAVAAPPPAAVPPEATARPAPPAAPAATAGPAPPPSARAGPQLAAADSTDALARFRESVSYLNDRAVAAAGVDLFTGVKATSNGVVQVTATDTWNHIPADGQDSFLSTLFDRWLAVAGGTQPVRVQVVDGSGHLLKEKSGP